MEGILDISTASTVLQKNELEEGLRLFQDNKITKTNAWSLSLIDNFSALIHKHHKSLKKFKFVASTLDATSQIYGLRVDSVHTDVNRLSTCLKAKPKQNSDIDSVQPVLESSLASESNSRRNLNVVVQPKIRKKHSKIVRNKETINAKLDTYSYHQFTNIHSSEFIGNNSAGLFNIMLPTIDSVLQHRTDKMFWDNSDEVTAMDSNEKNDAVIISFKNPLNLSKENILRPSQLSGVHIQNTPLSDNDDLLKNDECQVDNVQNSDENPFWCDNNYEQINTEFSFDINGEIEPIAAQDILSTENNMNMANLEVTTEEQEEIMMCTHLNPTINQLSDLRPINSSSMNLEYSYRNFIKSNHIWAGPLYWKLPKLIQSGSNIIKISKNRKRKQNDPILFSDNPQINTEPLRNIKEINLTNSARKLLKLPVNMKYKSDRFDKFHFALGALLTINSEINPTTSVASDNQIIQLENIESDQNNSISNDHASVNHSDPLNEIIQEVPAAEERIDSDHNNLISNDVDPTDEIIQEVSVPEGRIGKIPVVPYAKLSKSINMKELKEICMHLIRQELFENKEKNLLEFGNNDDQYQPGSAYFSSIYQKLQTNFAKQFKNELSFSIVYFAVLHLCEPYNLRLFSHNSHDIIIRQCLNVDSGSG